MNILHPRIMHLALITLVLLSSEAIAIPLENSFPTSAKYSGLGGTTVSHVSGPDALLHNPAGLAASEGFHLVLNLGPSVFSRKGPVAGANEVIMSKVAFSPLAEVAASYSLIPGLTVGAGLSVAGGLGVDYGNVTYTGFPVSPAINTSLGTVEANLGAGYQITPEWSVGAGWRASYFIPGEAHSAQLIPGMAVVVLDATGLTGSNFAGFRVGTQYRQKDGKWGIGAALRNSVDWNFKGTGTITMITAAGAAPAVPAGNVEFKLIFPVRATLGGNWKLDDLNEFFLQYDFYKYSSNQSRDVTVGTTVTPSKMEWKDVHVFHLGYQHGVTNNWPIRVGYAIETPGIPADRPDVTNAGPAVTHGFSVGTDKSLGERLGMSGALIYQMNSGTGTPAADSLSYAGEYGVKSLTLAGSLHW